MIYLTKVLLVALAMAFLTPGLPLRPVPKSCGSPKRALLKLSADFKTGKTRLKKACRMTMCNYDLDKKRPTVYALDEGVQGTGAKFKILMHGLTLAANHSMHFGGVLQRAGGHIVDYHDYPAFVESFLGHETYNELYIPYKAQKDIPHFDVVVNAGDFTDAAAKKYNPHAHVLVTEAGTMDFIEPDTRVAAALRDHVVRTKPVKFAPNIPSVAVHVRKGNRRRECLTPDSKIVEAVRTFQHGFAPNADIHVWSSTTNDGSDAGSGESQDNYTSADFDEYRKYGFKVHLDDDDLSEVWTNFIRANYTFVDDSLFSLVPSMLNPGTVLCDLSPTICHINSHHVTLDELLKTKGQGSNFQRWSSKPAQK